MSMIPKTVGELQKYLETFEDDMPIFTEDSEGLLWWFSIDEESEDPTEYEGAVPYLMISPFKVLNSWQEIGEQNK